MADFSLSIPKPIATVDELAALLSFWNDEICKQQQNGKSSIYSVAYLSDKGENVVWFKDTDTAPQVPSLVKDFPTTMSDDLRGQTIQSIATAQNVQLRSSSVVLLGGQPTWVALFDPAPGAPVAAPLAPSPKPVTVQGQIDSGHWLVGAQKEPIAGGNDLTPQFVVIHYTEGFFAEGSIDGWRKAADGVLAHIVIDRNGTVFQCRPFNRSCGHAGGKGDSRWRNPKTDELHDGVNSVSIGIEIANTGVNETYHRKLGTGKPYPEGTTIQARHRNGSKGSEEARDGREWEVYPEPQIKAVFDLVSLLVAKYQLCDITGHDCVAPERKADPGPAFPMLKLRQANRLEGLPTVWGQDGHKIDV